MADARAFIEMIRAKEVPTLSGRDETIMYTLYNDLAEECFVLLKSCDDVNPSTTPSGQGLKFKDMSSENALCKIIKARVTVKMQRWPVPDGDKSMTVGVKLLQMLLFGMESRDVGMGVLERVVGQALDGMKRKKEQKERDELKGRDEKMGDEMEGVEADSAEMVIQEENGDTFNGTEVESAELAVRETKGDAFKGIEVESTEMATPDKKGDAFEGIKFEHAEMTVQGEEGEVVQNSFEDSFEDSPEDAFEDAVEGNEVESADMVVEEGN